MLYSHCRGDSDSSSTARLSPYLAVEHLGLKNEDSKVGIYLRYVHVNETILCMKQVSTTYVFTSSSNQLSLRIALLTFPNATGIYSQYMP